MQWSVLLLLGFQSVPASQPTTFRITGRVVDAAGAPLAAGITLGDPTAVRTEHALHAPAARTGADGSFSVDVPMRPPEDPREDGPALLIAAPGHAAAWLTVPIPEGGSPAPRHDLGQVMLPPGAELRGCVTGPGGRPVAGARVRARDLLTPDLWRTDSWASQGVTAANGVFSLPCVVPNAAAVTIEADGFARRDIAPVSCAELVLVELLPTGFVTGRVVTAGTDPWISGVRLQSEWSVDSRLHGVGPDGTFRVPLPFPGRFVVRAERGRHGFGCSELLSGAATDVRVPVDLSGSRRVLIRDGHTGQPLPQARAIWTPLPAPREEWQHLRAGLVPADAGGLIRLARQRVVDPLGGPEGGVLVEAPGYASQLIGGAPGVVQLDPDTVVEGLVLDHGGRPAAGIRIAWRPPSDGAPDFGEVTTDGAGRFQIRGMWPGHFLLSARVPGSFSGANAPVQVTAGRATVELRLPPVRVVRGQVVGAPAGTRIAAIPARRSVRTVRAVVRGGITAAVPDADWAIVAADGRFTLPFADAERDAVVFALWFPSAPRCGPALVAEAARVAPLDPEIDQTVDARGLLPATVRLLVRYDGHAASQELRPRLALLATVPQEASVPVREDALRNWRWCAPQGDRFELQLRPGQHQLELRDMGTGVVYWRDAAPRELAPGAAVALAVKVAARSVEITLVGPNRMAPAIELLHVRIGQEAVALAEAPEPMDTPWGPALRTLPFSGRTPFPWLGRAVDVLGASGPVRMPLPEGPLYFLAAPGSSKLQPTGKTDPDGEPLGTASSVANPEAKDPIRITLSLPSAPELSVTR